MFFVQTLNRKETDVNQNVVADEECSCGCQVEEETCDEGENIEIDEFYYDQNECCEEIQDCPCEAQIQPEISEQSMTVEQEEETCCCCECNCQEETEMVLDCSSEVVQRLESCIKEKLKVCIEETLKENFCMKVQDEGCGLSGTSFSIPLTEKEPELIAGIFDGDKDVNGGSNDDYGLQEPPSNVSSGATSQSSVNDNNNNASNRSSSDCMN